jgi:hypothetical protein
MGQFLFRFLGKAEIEDLQGMTCSRQGSGKKGEADGKDRVRGPFPVD